MTAKEAMQIRKNPTSNDVDNDELSKCIDYALEKQIPKKPDYATTGDGISIYRACPTCNQPIVNVWKTDAYNPKYCHYCGQALDWGEFQEDCKSK